MLPSGFSTYYKKINKHWTQVKICFERDNIFEERFYLLLAQEIGGILSQALEKMNKILGTCSGLKQKNPN